MPDDLIRRPAGTKAGGLPVLAALLDHAADMPDATAFICGDARLSWRQLAFRVAGCMEALADAPPVIGLMAGNSLDWVVHDLAITALGRTLVPLPPFFSDAQLAHLVEAGWIGLVLADAANRPRAAWPVAETRALVTDSATSLDALYKAQPDNHARLIFTSGSTGNPKGVIIGAPQLRASTEGLRQASHARAGQRHLSTLPFALLLEQICGIHLPVLAGACTTLACDAALAALTGNPAPLLHALLHTCPHSTVLVPDQLRGLLAAMSLQGVQAPNSLEFIAVGGAPVSAPLLIKARAAGLPVCQGFGLSECCSVVAVTRPDKARDTAGNLNCGKALNGTEITLDPESSEILVTGQTVMQGYLGQPPLPRDAQGRATWRTGDLGRMEADGSLTVLGRKDALIVTGNGRNISPEWIEALLTADPRIGFAAVLPYGTGLGAVLAPSPLAPPDLSLASIMTATLAAAPDWARPQLIAETSFADLARSGLITPNARPRRKALAAQYSQQTEME